MQLKCGDVLKQIKWTHCNIKQINVYVLQIFSGITANSFENKWRQNYETLIAMGRFKWGYRYSQMLHNTKCFYITTKIDWTEVKLRIMT